MLGSSTATSVLSYDSSLTNPIPQIYGTIIDPKLVVRESSESNYIPTQLSEFESVSPRNLSTYALSRKQTFACVAMMENRNVDLDPDILDQVIALNRKLDLCKYASVL